jgi:mono/diheme cytochrome c family protein
METPQKDYQKLARLSRQVAWGIGTIILVLLGCLTYSFLRFNENKVPENMAWCGVVDEALSDNAALGKSLFISNCAICHSKNMKETLTGPPLGGSFEAWKYDTIAYFTFIRDSQRSIKNKHPRALKTWRAYRPTFMTSFPDLTDQELYAILAYIDAKK